MATELSDDEVLMCNCAECRVELLGESMQPYLRRNSARRIPAEYARIAIVAGRCLDKRTDVHRPYCEQCFHSTDLTKRRRDEILGSLFHGNRG